MNAELLKQSKEFKRKAKSLAGGIKKESKKSSTATTSQAEEHLDGAPNSSLLHYRYGVLYKIVRHLKTRFQRGNKNALEIDEILEETDQLDCLRSTKIWLTKNGLPEHPKVDVVAEGKKYRFKPTYKIKDGKSLMRLLKQHDLKGLGGILYDDVYESLPNCDKILNKNHNEIVTVVRSHDKKKVLFYNDRTASLEVDEEFQKLWRSLNMDAINEAKIEDYLNKECNGAIQSGQVEKKPMPKRRKQSQKKRVSKKSKDNEHLSDILMDFSENPPDAMT